MSVAESPREALQRIPGWAERELSVEPLLGGLTNRSYRLSDGDCELVLRLDAAHTQVFALDRHLELGVLRVAEAAGVGPRVLFADPESGILLTEYMPGRAWTRAMLSEPKHVERVAALLRRVHALPLCGERFDASAAAARYLDVLPKHHALRGSCERAARELKTFAPAIWRCCHNDVVAANLIGWSAPQLIDWEYACDNDPAFDLASLIEYHDLDESAARCLIEAYAASACASFAERVHEQRWVYRRLEFLWRAARNANDDSRRDERLHALAARLDDESHS